MQSSSPRRVAFWATLLFFVLQACGTPRPFYSEKGHASIPDSVKAKTPAYEVFLIGDTGNPVLGGHDYTLEALHTQLQQAGDSSSVVFLGDNIYQDGMNPDTTIQAERQDEAIITRTMNALDNYGGQSFFIPGNHDWRYGARGVRAQEEYVESYQGANVNYVPSDGCPGPNGFQLGDNWYLITLDSEWFINQSYKDFVEVDQCEYKTRVDVMNRTAELIEEHDDSRILISFHHPLDSQGNHAGYYSVKDHIFPITNKVDWLYLPLPIIGSIYPIYRKLGQSGQDLNHFRYEYFVNEIRERAENLENVYFASGHEHSLSFYQKNKVDDNKDGTDHIIVSGAGSKHSYARTGFGAEFVYSHLGFAKLLSYDDGSVDLQYWVPDDGEHDEGKLVYYKQLVKPENERASKISTSLRDTTVQGPKDSLTTVAAGPDYAAGGFHRTIWGDHYRDAWTKEVEMPIFDLDNINGGLEVLNVTGGEQTVTLILQDSTDNRFVMRSVEKNPKESLPFVLQKTFVTDIAQDQNSASHPYGMLVVPTLADAAGVYGTHPRVGFLSNKSGIDLKMGDRPGAVVSLEEFVSTDWFNNTYGQQATEITGSDDLWERKRRGEDILINQKQLVRSRLFDMFIDDWDRHEGQWFWAATPTDSITTYTPIPIDRDNAFFMSDGAIPWIGRREWALRKFQLFDDDIRDMAGMNYNGRFFDRWFINSLTHDEWLAIAHEMQDALTDSVIENAIAQWPAEIQEINGAYFTKTLKGRRDNLIEFAERYYKLLSKQVNVYGSDEVDDFNVERLPDGRTHVTAYKNMRADGQGRNIVAFERTFNPDVTDEVRLYGFGEDDRFTLSGHSDDDAIVVRIIGGEGEDFIGDNSTADGWGRKTMLYDTYDGATITADAGEINSEQSRDPNVNRFENRSFEYPVTAPLLSAGFNRDDGLFLGGGALITTQGFRQNPFAAQHSITLMHSIRTTSFSFNYDAVHTDEIGTLDLTIDAQVLAPQFATNYFGIGNETQNNRNYNFYNYQLDNGDIELGVAESVEDLLFVRGGLGYEYYRPIRTDDTFITSPQSDVPNTAFERYHYANLYLGLRVASLDNKLIPHYGVDFSVGTQFNVGLNDRSRSFTRFNTVGKAYNTIEAINTTIATRVGFAHNFGGYNFFQANTLGGQRVFTAPGNLRGFARNRFSGRTSLFHNTELRTELGTIDSYIFPARFGVNVFVDEGRVWADNESSNKVHVGYGGGVWFAPLEYIVVDANYAFSTEDSFLSVTLGYNF